VGDALMYTPPLTSRCRALLGLLLCAKALVAHCVAGGRSDPAARGCP
jgi:hypothetical protein